MDDDNPYKDDQTDFKAAQEMDETVKTVFAPIYPVIADQIRQKFDITTGQCIDLGSGPAALSISLARITRLQIHAMDVSRHSFRIARKNIEEQGLGDRIRPLIGDVEDMPFKDDFADLIISRGSIFFWDNLVQAFNEIYRVLKPGGKTYIGGGFGTAELRKIIFEEMAKKRSDFKCRLTPENIMRIKNAIEQSKILKHEITHGEAGFWIHITKENECEM